MTQDDETNTTRRVAEELLRRIGAGDHDGVAALFADDFEWELSWPAAELAGEIPWIRERHTRADVAEHFRALAEHNTPHDGGTTIERIVVDGPDAVILGTVRNVLHRTSRAYRAAVALHLRVEDGLVRRYCVYEDSLAVARAWQGDSLPIGGAHG